MTLIDEIISYEMGELDTDQIIDLFQRLIHSGMIYHLQGSYGRMAQHLIDEGLCTE